LGALSAHLIASASEHGRLRFHPDCPRCNDRLAGNLCGDQVLSRRGTAAVAAGVLALSSAAPAAAIPPEPDQEQEGTAEPPPATGDVLYDPGFDPGGEDTVLEVEVGPVTAPEAGGQEDTGEGLPVETEPIDDPEARLVLPDETDPAPAPLSVTVPPQPEAQAPVPDPAPPAEEVTATPPPAPEVPRIDERRDKGHQRDRPPRRESAPMDKQPPPPAAGTPVASQQPEAPVAVPVPEPVTQPVAVALPAPPPIEGDAYRVRPGDSLWSIAKRLLGPDASNGRIAKEVNRLWQLNAARIATGDASLIHPGTELRLR
jgi:LysM domain